MSKVFQFGIFIMSGENKRIDGDYDSSLSNTRSTRNHRCLSGAMWS